MNINNKKGSYIVEAVITLPIFIVAVAVMLSIILLYACIEMANYTLANELRNESLLSNYSSGGALFAAGTTRGVKSTDAHISSLTINDYSYRGIRSGIDEVIAVSYDMKMKVDNPLGLASKAGYDLSLMTRAYVGKIGDDDPMSDDEFAGDISDPVFIFPKSGERYHKDNCTFVRAASVTAILTPSIRNKYGSCPICHSKGAADGVRIYYFPQYGESYHFAGCPVLQRNYIEVDKKDAIKRGYTACKKCGG